MPSNRIPIRVLALVFLCGIFCVPSFGQSSENSSIDEYIKPFADAGHFSGVVVASKDGKIFFHKAYGTANIEHDVHNQPNMRFNIASVTKAMTGVILARLIEAGKLKSDDKIIKFIPDFPKGEKITVEMLAVHRSGLPHRITTPEQEAIPTSAMQMAERAKEASLAFEPGSGELYSSLGYAVLARILEVASGKTFGDLLEFYVFEPAQMGNTLDFDSSRIIKRKSEDYLLDDTGYMPSPLKDYSFLAGAGSVFSTAEDIHKFAFSVIQGNYGGVVKQNLLRKGVIRSNGSTNGYRCNLMIDTVRGLGFVLVSNLGSGANDLIIRNLPDLIEGKKFNPPEVPKPVIDRSVHNNLSDYVGKYSLGGSSFEILVHGEQLFAGPFKLLPLGKDRFYSYWSYADISFHRGEDETVSGLTWVGSAGRSEWKRR